MSNHLAIATVTATLRHMLQDRIQQAVPGAQVRTVRPDAIAKDQQARGVNLYLFQVNPNPTFRNVDLMTRRSDGTLAQRPQMAVDVHYIISFYGAEEQLEPQRLLGVTVSTLHAWPEIGRDEIRAALGAAPGAFLNGSDLADQIVTVKTSMTSLTTDELSKLWSVFFQVPYLLSVCYQASVVLLEAEDTFPQPALPTKGARATSGPMSAPWIEAVDPGTVEAMPGTQIRLRGRNLIGDDAVVVVDGVAAPTLLDGDSLVASLPDGLRAGPRAVRVVKRGSGDGTQPPVDSNPAALVIQPRLTGVVAAGSIVDPRNSQRLRVVTVPVEPPVGPRQRVLLHLNELGALGRQPFAISTDRLLRFDVAPSHTDDLDGQTVSGALREEFRRSGVDLGEGASVQVEIPGQRWTVVDRAAGQTYATRLIDDRIVVYIGLGAGADGNLAFQLGDVPPGNYLVRVEIDGVGSVLESDPDSGLYSGPRVAL
jgi:hypothetical protein